MSVIFSHNSALEYLRSVPPQVRDDCRNETAISLRAASTSPRELANTDATELGIRQRPLHVLTEKGRTLVKARDTVCHTSTLPELPAGSMIEAAPDILVGGPELTYIQMMAATSELGAVVLGHELCGRYSHFAQMASGFYDREPLTNTASILTTAENLRRSAGVAKARDALRFVRDGSRSPMETVVSCMLLLPGTRGGWSLANPQLNYRVRLDDAASRITGTKTCAIDVAWPQQRVGVEYDSATFHDDPERDRRRREALTHMGWRIYVIELDDIHSYRQLAEKVDLFADQIPVRPGVRASSADERRHLLDRLLHATRFGRGMHAALFGVPVPHGTVTIHL